MTSPERAVFGAVIYVGLAIGALITLAPFMLSLLTSFTSAKQFNTSAPLSWPSPPTLGNYTGLADAGFGRALLVTALMTAVILLGQMSFSVLAAYAFARLRFPGRDALFWVYIATLMVPATVTVVPLYLMVTSPTAKAVGFFYAAVAACRASPALSMLRAACSSAGA